MSRHRQRWAADLATQLRRERGVTLPDPEFRHGYAVEAALRPHMPLDETRRKATRDWFVRAAEARACGVPSQRDAHTPEGELAEEDLVHGVAVISLEVGRVGLADLEPIDTERAARALAALERHLQRASHEAQ